MHVKNINEIYKCAICGNIVEVTHVGGGELVCCGQPMNLQEANTIEASKEKHVPVIEKHDNKIVVKIGSVAHPMEEAHHIEWIEIISDSKSYKQFLKPGEKPEAEFAELKKTTSNITARAYCNLHGLWKAEI